MIPINRSKFLATLAERSEPDEIVLRFRFFVQRNLRAFGGHWARFRVQSDRVFCPSGKTRCCGHFGGATKWPADTLPPPVPSL
jgi:hypothetical protein